MNDAAFMERCLFLAKKGLGNTYPNPLVGCVIVCEGKIIAEGWHKKAGANHAEREAILNIRDQSLLSKSSLYVNLEPCDHYGKTPPCTDLILEMKIPRVIIGCLDQNKRVSRDFLVGQPNKFYIDLVILTVVSDFPLQFCKPST